MKKRISWIDIAKGMAIILVIIGHSISWNSKLRLVIYSFHMPLFFSLTAMTFRHSQNFKEFLQKCSKDFKGLVLPAISIWFIVSIIILRESTDIVSFTFSRLETLFWSSGIDFYNLNHRILGIDMPWFLIVLFISKQLNDFLFLTFKKKIWGILSLTLTILGLFLSLNKIFLPFSFDLVLVVQIYYLTPILFKYLEKYKYLLLLIWIMTAFVYIKLGQDVDFASRTFSNPFVTIPFSVFCIFLVFYFSKLLDMIPFIGKSFAFFGKISLLIFLVHCLDRYLVFFWSSTKFSIPPTIGRITFDLSVAVLASICINFFHSINSRSNT